jgi:hypothetical protein
LQFFEIGTVSNNKKFPIDEMVRRLSICRATDGNCKGIITDVRNFHMDLSEKG